MEGSEFLIAALAIITGTGLAGYIFMNIFKLIRSWIGGSSEVPEEEFNRLARAFMEHKKETQRRIQNLEAIITEDGSDESFEHEESPTQIEAPKKSIEFDDSENVSEESESGGNKNNLRNMLRE
ncbi:hypothetical protein [Fodinibius sp.]|uniref:hypothetical protein n=1 Tax=Fodinibius sp. TaxID=1872440 RepID=UPI002ACEB3DE|nr:hypothetical protein [Fodinibius sp.]MDZ7659897.1 hypothetical protein [Fodinibius sp.]